MSHAIGQTLFALFRETPKPVALSMIATLPDNAALREKTKFKRPDIEKRWDHPL